MTALTKDRSWKSRTGTDHEGPAAAGVKIFEGALVARDAAGNITKGAVATTLKACGVAMKFVDNTAGAAAAVNVPFRRGSFYFVSDPADPVTKADVENDVYITDDQTICRTNGGATKSKAGKLLDIDGYGALVRIG